MCSKSLLQSHRNDYMHIWAKAWLSILTVISFTNICKNAGKVSY